MISIQTKIWLERAGLLSEAKKTKEQKIKEFLKRLEAEIHDEEESDEEFPEDENEYYHNLDESTKRNTVDAKSNAKVGEKLSSNSKGVLHELLVGYHLRGKKHMEKHVDKQGDSPKQVHDKIKSQMHPDEYKKENEKAKSAAESVRKHIEKNGHKVHDVHWTSKPGDTERSTGIKASQKEDASDIVVHSHKNGKTKYHGVSLKITDGTNKHITASNPGMEATHGGHHIVAEHRKKVLEKYPELHKTKNKKERKELMSKNPEMKSHITHANYETTSKLAAHTADQLKKKSKEDLVHHIKTHVLQSNKTPMQHNGHEHIRHTTYAGGKKEGGVLKHDITNPSEHWDHKLKDHENLEVHHEGTTIYFKHKGKVFASHRMRPSSISDPMTSFKGDGKAHGD